MKGFFRDDSGQAVVEYVLMVMLALSVVSVIGITFRKTVIRMWEMISKDVAAACPGCPPPSGVSFR